MDVNSLEINLLVTLFVAALVFLLPLADQWICRRLRLNLEGGLSENPNADRLLRPSAICRWALDKNLPTRYTIVKERDTMAEEVKTEDVAEDVTEIVEEPKDDAGVYDSLREVVRKLDDLINVLDEIKRNTDKPERKPLPEKLESAESRPTLLDM